MEIIDTADIDYLPKGRPRRRRPVADEFDRECGYSYDHDWVFVTFTKFGDREYECANCGDHTVMGGYNCDVDIHEMLEVGALELAFAPSPFKTRQTIDAMREDGKTLRRHHRRSSAQRQAEVDLDA